MRPALAALVVLAVPFARAQTTIRMMAGAGYGIPPKEATGTTVQVRRAVFEAFHKANPDVRVVNAGGLTLAGDNAADNAFLMSMASGEGPDVFYVNFRQYHTFLDQGFCRSLEDLIARDPSIIARVNPTVDKVLRSYDGKRYAVPFFQVAVALYYRRDFFAAAGIKRPPQDWDEFREDARRLTVPGRYGFDLSSKSYQWQNFLYQAGGEVVRQDADGRWRSAVETPEAATALEFYRGLATETWKAGGRTLGPALNDAKDLSADIREGKVAMWLNYTNDVVLNGAGELPPSVVGVAALPAGPRGRRNEVNAGMWAISSQVRDPKRLEACWRFIRFFAGDEAARVNTAKCVELGLGDQVNPLWLEKFGYADVARNVDPSYVEANRSLFKTGHPEPYGRNCQQVYAVLDNALDEARLEPATPASAILARTAREMDRKLLNFTPAETLRKQRAWTTGGLLFFALAVVGAGLYKSCRSFKSYRTYRETERLPAGVSRRRVWLFLALCLAPAALSILTWAYYPLGRGLTMAFQDYRVLGGSRWVGVDNFVAVFTQPVFWRAMLNSFLYVTLSIVVGFLLPIALALALAEIPRGKAFFRTVFYLPAMTSSVVVAFLWRQFYDKTDAGVLNALVHPVVAHVLNPLGCGLPASFDWLGDPSLAMFAVVLPGIWAGAGPGSILYLAALKNVPEERYEAADLDGATWLQKIRHIVLPGLKPLILINLLGVFVGGFKAMENVFVLTQGGPLDSTRTLGLEVWQNAFMYLRFGYATAAAWVMGSILVGFTLVQIRTLMKMRFTAAR